MNKFLETYNVRLRPKQCKTETETYNIRLNQKEIENLNRPISSREIESVTRNLPIKKTLDKMVHW